MTRARPFPAAAGDLRWLPERSLEDDPELSPQDLEFSQLLVKAYPVSGDRGQGPKLLIDEDSLPWVAHDVLGKVVDTLAAEYAAGRGMVNRVLRVSLHGAKAFFELPQQRQWLTITRKRGISVKLLGERAIFTGEVGVFTGEDDWLSALCCAAA